jgi:hypothetical protein
VESEAVRSPQTTITPPPPTPEHSLLQASSRVQIAEVLLADEAAAPESLESTSSGLSELSGLKGNVYHSTVMTGSMIHAPFIFTPHFDAEEYNKPLNEHDLTKKENEDLKEKLLSMEKLLAEYQRQIQTLRMAASERQNSKDGQQSQQQSPQKVAPNEQEDKPRDSARPIGKTGARRLESHAIEIQVKIFNL